MDSRLLLAAALLGALVSGCWQVDAEAKRPPDVIVLVIDTLRADRLGCYGYERATSPNIDALAAEGVLFKDATAQASWTLVSMSSFWSGRYVTADLAAPDPQWTLMAETFREAGYRTIGRSANVLLSEESGFGRGFEDYDCYRTKGRYTGYRAAPDLVADLWKPVDRMLAEAKKPSDRKPFFLYLQPLDPHAPYHAHAQWEEELPPGETLPFPSEELHRELLARHGPPPPADDPDWSGALRELYRQRGLYDQEIRFVDHQIGVLLDGLRRRGLLDNAIIAIVSDHGEGLWDHPTPMPEERLSEHPPKSFFFGGHGYTMYQEALHTPFILWGTGIPKGLEVSEPIENIDLFPTLLGLTGLTPAIELDGRSLLGLMSGKEPERRRYVFAFVHHYAAVRDRETGMKLISPTEFGRQRGGLVPLLYDLTSDPFEHHDLAPSRPQEVERLQSVLDAWTARHPVRRDVEVPHDPKQLELLKEMGYTSDHTPRLGD